MKHAKTKSLLTDKEAEIINESAIRYGDVITFEQIYSLFRHNHSRSYLRRLVSKLVRNGWLVRLKKGEYYVSDLSNLGRTSLSVYFTANYFVRESYVSFGQALQYHGMYDQLLATVSSVSLKQQQARQIDGIKYRYVKTQEKYYYGFQTERVDGKRVRIATVEKALIDLLQFHRTENSFNLALEKVINYKSELNLTLLMEYIGYSTNSVQRIFGFILDLAGINSTPLKELAASSRTIAKITADSKYFNADWGVYYDSAIIEE